jgi:hypothetical protein
VHRAAPKLPPNLPGGVGGLSGQAASSWAAQTLAAVPVEGLSRYTQRQLEADSGAPPEPAGSGCADYKEWKARRAAMTAEERAAEQLGARDREDWEYAYGEVVTSASRIKWDPSSAETAAYLAIGEDDHGDVGYRLMDEKTRARGAKARAKALKDAARDARRDQLAEEAGYSDWDDLCEQARGVDGDEPDEDARAVKEDITERLREEAAAAKKSKAKPAA